MTKLFVVVCRDRPGSRPTRMQRLAEHLAHVEKVLGRIRVAGPLRDEAGDGYTGSVLVIEADSVADARAFMEADPYFHAGIWESVTIDQLGHAVGEWVGGKTW